MYKKSIKIFIKNGLHIRPMIKIIKLSKQFKSKIFIIHNNNFFYIYDIFKFNFLNILYGDIITICALGIDKYKSVNKILYLINKLNKG